MVMIPPRWHAVITLEYDGLCSTVISSGTDREVAADCVGPLSVMIGRAIQECAARDLLTGQVAFCIRVEV